MTKEIEPFYSIIVPTYNVESTITKCIESILSQTEQSFEILIIDGVSTDQTLHLLQGYLNSNSQIILKSAPDHGIYDAMNKGISLAKGKFLYFLGADDYLFDKEVLKDMRTFIEKTTSSIVYGNVESNNLGNKYDGVFNDSKIFHKNIAHQSIFFERAVFYITGNFNLKYHIHADWDHNLKWFFNPSLKNVYYNRIIAHFSDGGYSSQSKDHPFRKEIITKYYLNARKKNSVFVTIVHIFKGLILRLTR